MNLVYKWPSKNNKNVNRLNLQQLERLQQPSITTTPSITSITQYYYKKPFLGLLKCI